MALCSSSLLPAPCATLNGTMQRPAFFFSPFGLVLAAAICSHALVAQGLVRGRGSAEDRAAAAYARAVKQGPVALRAFLDPFPKGADLHVHLSGAVYAETFIHDAAEDGVCVDAAALKFAPPPCTGSLIPAAQLSGNLSSADQALYDKLIDAFSMRSFEPTLGWSGHDQFFATFARFDGLSASHIGEWVDEVAGRAAAQNQQYLELMQTPPFSHARQTAARIGWSPQLAAADLRAFAQLRQQLLDSGLRDEVAAGRAQVQQAEAQRRLLERCGAPRAASACRVEVRYIYQLLRANAPEDVFAQALLGFETVSASRVANDDLWVGINLVQPEDGYVSMRDYTLQMKIIGYLHSIYPDVPISLHAGELVMGLVPPEGLRFHIRQAVELAHAQRIGHGVDVADEDDAPGLLKEMAARHIMVEINLSSNEAILGVNGARHPFPIYRADKVPVALSTDDEGVSRIDLTHEFVRAAIDYNLSYSDLKRLARTSLEHSFLPGKSLWLRPDDFQAAAQPCRSDTPGAQKPSPACAAYLGGSEKAAAQWELERRFSAFDSLF